MCFGVVANPNINEKMFTKNKLPLIQCCADDLSVGCINNITNRMHSIIYFINNKFLYDDDLFF